EEEARKRAIEEKRKKIEEARRGKVHPPYAAKMCDACHVIQSRGAIPTGVDFVTKKTKLCGMCHDDKSQESLAESYRFVHAPAQYGACVMCHNPHESPNKFMLQTAPMGRLCFRCHEGNRIMRTPAHSGIGKESCTKCHDPHGSNRRFMLKETLNLPKSKDLSPENVKRGKERRRG
ncbi:MAG: hypothetical protein GXP58_03285, partial [Deltaproteobacteria bacterium]|nr:hypothetical protein [Deltaproteobacteria bacterium]